MATKKKTDILICEECLKSTDTSDLKETDFYWMNKISQISESCEPFEYGILFCKKCADKSDLNTIEPYKVTKKRGRPKKDDI